MDPAQLVGFFTVFFVDMIAEKDFDTGPMLVAEIGVRGGGNGEKNVLRKFFDQQFCVIEWEWGLQQDDIHEV